MEPFFLVYDPSYTQASPRKQYRTKDEAVTVAKAILRKNDSNQVFVMAPIAVVELATPPVTITDIPGAAAAS